MVSIPSDYIILCLKRKYLARDCEAGRSEPTHWWLEIWKKCSFRLFRLASGKVIHICNHLHVRWWIFNVSRFSSFPWWSSHDPTMPVQDFTIERPKLLERSCSLRLFALQQSLWCREIAGSSTSSTGFQMPSPSFWRGHNCQLLQLVPSAASGCCGTSPWQQRDVVGHHHHDVAGQGSSLVRGLELAFEHS